MNSKTILLPLLVLVIVNGAAYTAYKTNIEIEDQHAHYAFKVEAEKQFNVFSLVLKSKIGIARSMKAYFEGSKFVSRAEFKVFSSTILKAHPEIQALNWLPKIRHAQRASFEQGIQDEGFKHYQIMDIVGNQLEVAPKHELYYPIKYYEPLQANKKVHLLNTISSSQALGAVARLSTQIEYSISAPLTLVQEQSEQKGVLIFFPIIQNQQRLGIVELVLRLGDLLQYSQGLLGDNKKMVVNLVDISKEGLQPLVMPKHIDDKHLYQQHTLSFGGRIWQMAFYPTTDLLEHHHEHEEDILFSYLIRGPVISFFIAGLLLILLRQTEKLKASKERTQQIINLSADAYFLYDKKGEILDVNQHACDEVGYSREELLDLKIVDITNVNQCQLDELLGVLKLGEFQTIPCQHVHKDGHIISVEVSISHFLLEGKTVFSAFSRDITEREKQQAELIRLKELAEEASRTKSEFLANMSHELRTPMHGILSFSNFGIKKIKTASQDKLKQYFSNIHLSGSRLLVLLNDLLDLSKLEAGKMVLNKRPTDLNILFESCYAEQQQRMLDMSLTLVFNPEQAPLAEFDPDRIGQVVTNILSNAIKFSPEKGVITVNITQEKQQLKFSLHDQGLGIPSNELDTIFDAFIQSSTTKTGSGGTGLGLAISKKIMEQHGGNIWAKSESNIGSTLLFTLPFTKESEHD